MKNEKTLAEMQEDIKTDNVKGLTQLENYRSSQLNLDGFKFTKVLGDILMCQYIDQSEDGTEIKRGSLYLPLQVMERGLIWRIAKVLLAGGNTSIKPGEIVVFPNDKGIPVAKMGNMKNLVFLNEERIFGVVEPE